MNLKQRQSSEVLTKSSSENDSSRNFILGQSYTYFDSQQNQKWDISENVGYGIGMEKPFTEYRAPLEQPSSGPFDPEDETKRSDQVDVTTKINNLLPDWDSGLMLSNLSFLEQKIHQLQDLIHSIGNRESQFLGRPSELVAQRQLVTADLTSIIIQLISTAGTLLPAAKSSSSASNPFAGQLDRIIGGSTSLEMNIDLQQNDGMAVGGNKNCSNYDDHVKTSSICGDKQKYVDQSGFTFNGSEPLGTAEDHGMKDSEDAAVEENLPPGSYEVLQLEREEILAPHTHFCSICGKGFKRDANLRMHMRGHGDEYKTPAALAKPSKESNAEPMLLRRYSCPYVGCKRNKDHKKFQPLKTILCVKNHYKRSHCDKSYTCSRCNCKKFSVIADLKTHEKHCGRDKWLCSCGTTFSRKDKLFGHVALFQGHTPVILVDDVQGSGASDHGQNNEATTGLGSEGFDFSLSTSNGAQVLNVKSNEDSNYFSPMNFDACNFTGIPDFSPTAFEVSESSFSFPPSGSCNLIAKTGENSSVL